MKKDLYLFSRIIHHLEYLTTYDQHGTCRSRGVEKIWQLCEELNKVGIVPARGYWTTRSLECFLPRIRKRYSPETIAEVCDRRLVGSSNWEYISATRASEVMNIRHDAPPPPRRKKSKEAKCVGYIPLENERWLPHEEPELFREAARIKKTARAKKLYGDCV